ncbi:RNA polymerase, sigma-24 subunit, ECF subfamily [Gluconacetobacter diazotrophicus PA1 5]|uniref:RNA polymerase sigma factor n=1 Tax=Gluconacetobacter diazotrophicus (strain ATCC 49037 / DSM 5601 / CCUG 37298 / CIP 103539 / LMG 7603 / PAl5) TaxID=272568 RepID=A9HHV2_GLUDA|nr:sigma-70 family RNA polymerase sigma factor [Gluconacetobacter diazotrophicus]ACI53245.1 RNA polymerase, sigma-24 subunit, ECF subfamily [Gluconacetobacter diazotrophicus PA1 5]TWB10378.1 RNA polymerase sigma-70 factor (ECF subfamily) [Gluconacetobacter diazotrophicus]CAP55685.1 putative RNA polymerase sigma-70 factor [Gluconacetobacter diazotrophicus PA1 5]
MCLLPDLRGFARFLTRDTAASDDLVQETVVRALGALEQFRADTNLKAWLFTIQRNIFYEQRRRNQRERLVMSDYAAEPRHGTQGRPASSGDDVRDLESVFWLLTPLLREALILVGAQEMTHEEAARICGVPVGTMKARVSRARARLAILVARPHEDCGLDADLECDPAADEAP